MKKYWWKKYNQIIFRTSLVLFVVLFALNYVFPGLVTSLFNPVFILIVVIVSGILAVVKE